MKKIQLFIAALLLTTMQTAMADKPKSGISYTEMKVQIARVQIKDNISFEDAVESLKLRANQHNLKFVGASPLYKEVEAVTGKPAKRMEIFSFCDARTAQQMIIANPNMISFMPCRIAMVEDQEGKHWLISMMMKDSMIAALPIEIRSNAQRVLAALKDMMLAASNGDL